MSGFVIEPRADRHGELCENKNTLLKKKSKNKIRRGGKLSIMGSEHEENNQNMWLGANIMQT